MKKERILVIFGLVIFLCWINDFTYAKTAEEKKESIIRPQIKELSLNIQKSFSKRLKEKHKLRIAIVELENLGDIAKEKNMGKVISEMLTTDMVLNKFFEIIEREQLDKALKELELSLKDVIDPKSAKKVGKILAADAVLCGSVSEMGQFFIINIRLVDVEKAVIIAAASIDIKIRKSDLFIEVRPLMGDDRKIIEYNLDALSIAIHNYSTVNLQKHRKLKFPRKLKELVPEYINRIPDPMKGYWKYNPENGTVINPGYPGVFSTIVFPQLKPVIDAVNRAIILGKMRNIRTAIMMYMAEWGKYPENLTDLVPDYLFELPDPMDGKWEYNSETGEVSNSMYEVKEGKW